MASIYYMADQALSNSFYKNVVVIGTIIGGFVYLERGMKTSVKEILAPYVEAQIEIKKDVQVNSIDINTLKEKSSLNDYKWSIYEGQIKSFLKPEEPEIKDKK